MSGVIEAVVMVSWGCAGGLVVGMSREEFATIVRFVLRTFVAAAVFVALVDIEATTSGLLGRVALGFGYGVVALLLGAGYCRLRKLTGSEQKVILAAATLMNCGYLGIPLAGASDADLAQEASLFAAIYTPWIVVCSSWLFRRDDQVWWRSLVTDALVIAMVAGIVVRGVPGLNQAAIVGVARDVSKAAPTVMLIAVGVGLSLKESRKITRMAVEAASVRAGCGAVIAAGLTLFEGVFAEAVRLQSVMPIGFLPAFYAASVGDDIGDMWGAIALGTIATLAVAGFIV